MACDGRLLGGIGVLAAVLDTGNFVRAGEALGLTPSGVSRAVARPEPTRDAGSIRGHTLIDCELLGSDPLCHCLLGGEASNQVQTPWIDQRVLVVVGKTEGKPDGIEPNPLDDLGAVALGDQLHQVGVILRCMRVADP